LKLVDIRIGEQVLIQCEGHEIRLVPQHKSGARIRFGVEADSDVTIGNVSRLAEVGVSGVDTVIR